MTYNELLEKVKSDRSDKVFAELYGSSETEAARKRYVKLITEMQKMEIDKAADLRIFSSPGRTELAGNHTDHNRGKVLAASIQLDNAAIVQKRKDNTVIYRSTGFDDVIVKLTDSYNEKEKGTTEALVKGIAEELKKRGCVVGGFSANADSTVLPGSGLSSSAALETLLGRIFDSIYGEGRRSAQEIAQIGQIAENVYFGKPCGLMDQLACSCGGAIAVDFADAENPKIKQINFDLSAAGYVLCVVNTGGNHADLTADYASIPAEMKNVAKFFGKSVLRELEKETVTSNAAGVRKALGDRSLLRAIHFFDENERVDAMTDALQKMENAPVVDKQEALYSYLELVNESGNSSWELLQNVYPNNHPSSQGIAAALALTKDFLRRQNLRGACRVHGGGFAGTIQAYLPRDAFNSYRAFAESVFGEGSVTALRVRSLGALELLF